MKKVKLWVLVALLLVSASFALIGGGHRADQLSFRVLDEATLRPVSGAFVCIGQKTDHNSSGFLDACSGTTNAQGRLTLTLPEGGGKTISIGANGYRAWHRNHMAIPDDPGKMTVELEPSAAHTFDYWGQLTGGNVSGVEIWTMAGGRFARSIADSNGMFYFAVDPSESWRLNTSSEFISENTWHVDTTGTYLFSDPDLITVTDTTYIDPVVHAVLASNGAPVPVDDTVSVLVSQIVPDEPRNTTWYDATPMDRGDPLVGWKLSRPLDQLHDYVLLTKCGTQWGAVVIDAAAPGEPQVVFQDQGTALLTANVLQSNGTPISSGFVTLTVESLGTGDLSGVSVPLAIMDVPQYGQVYFDSLPAGTYTLTYTGGFTSSTLTNIPISDGEVRQVDLDLAKQVVKDFSHDSGGTGTISGVVACPNGTLVEGTVFLDDPYQRGTEYMENIDETGVYHFGGVAPGVYLLGALGVSPDNERLFQLAGCENIGVSAYQTQVIDLEVYAPLCIRVFTPIVTQEASGKLTAEGVLEGVLVSVKDAGTGIEIFAGATDEDGNVFFYSIPVMELEISGSLTGYYTPSPGNVIINMGDHDGFASVVLPLLED